MTDLGRVGEERLLCLCNPMSLFLSLTDFNYNQFEHFLMELSEFMISLWSLQEYHLSPEQHIDLFNLENN